MTEALLVVRSRRHRDGRGLEQAAVSSTSMRFVAERSCAANRERNPPVAAGGDTAAGGSSSPSRRFGRRSRRAATPGALFPDSSRASAPRPRGGCDAQPTNAVAAPADEPGRCRIPWQRHSPLAPLLLDRCTILAGRGAPSALAGGGCLLTTADPVSAQARHAIHGTPASGDEQALKVVGETPLGERKRVSGSAAPCAAVRICEK